MICTDKPPLPTIGKNEEDALLEIERIQTGGGLRRIRPFYWRRASMQKLAAHGLVEPMPGYDHYKTPGMRITEAGRARVKEIADAL